MLDASSVLQTIGILMQAGGTLLVAIQVWRQGWASDSYHGPIDRKWSWPWKIRLGLLLYLFGYIPILWGV